MGLKVICFAPAEVMSRLFQQDTALVLASFISVNYKHYAIVVQGDLDRDNILDSLDDVRRQVVDRAKDLGHSSPADVDDIQIQRVVGYNNRVIAP